MADESKELREMLSDLKLIKEAVSKSDSILRFIDAGGALRAVLLGFGLLLAGFSAAFSYLFEQYGDFSAIPLDLRLLLFFLMALSFGGIGYVKLRNFMHGARRIRADISFERLLQDMFSARLTALLVPYLLVAVLVIIFLSEQGYASYVVPSLAILYGLLVIALNCLFLLREFYFLGVWLCATGLLTLFMAQSTHPLAALVLTFAAGSVLAGLLLYLGVPGEKRQGR
jgi:hypothetical protein